MKLSALVLTLVIALGISSPLDAKTKSKKIKAQHHTSQKAPKVSHKTPKVKKKTAKIKPMKYRKAKHSKAPKSQKAKRPKSV